MTTTQEWDAAAVLATNGLAGRWGLLDALMIGLAKYVHFVFAATLLLVWLIRTARAQRLALIAGIAALLALGAGQVIGLSFPRLRPYQALPVHLLVPHAPDSSFPSDHATLAFAVTAILWRLDRRLGAALLALSCVLAFARVFIGAHYPTDVVGGAILGSGVAAIVLALSERGPGRRAIDFIITILRQLRVAA